MRPQYYCCYKKKKKMKQKTKLRSHFIPKLQFGKHFYPNFIIDCRMRQIIIQSHCQCSCRFSFNVINNKTVTKVTIWFILSQHFNGQKNWLWSCHCALKHISNGFYHYPIFFKMVQIEFIGKLVLVFFKKISAKQIWLWKSNPFHYSYTF